MAELEFGRVSTKYYLLSAYEMPGMDSSKDFATTLHYGY